MQLQVLKSCHYCEKTVRKRDIKFVQKLVINNTIFRIIFCSKYSDNEDSSSTYLCGIKVNHVALNLLQIISKSTNPNLK